MASPTLQTIICTNWKIIFALSFFCESIFTFVLFKSLMMYYPTPEEGLFVLKTNVEVNVKNKTKSTPNTVAEPEKKTIVKNVQRPLYLRAL